MRVEIDPKIRRAFQEGIYDYYSEDLQVTHNLLNYFNPLLLEITVEKPGGFKEVTRFQTTTWNVKNIALSINERAKEKYLLGWEVNLVD